MRVLSAEAVVLLHPERWRVVLPSFSERHAAGEEPDRRRRRWSRDHAHAHAAPIRELLLCLDGRGFFGLAGRLHACRPGTLFVIDPEVAHDDYYPATADGLIHVWLRAMGPRVFVSWFRVSRGRLTPLHKFLTVLDAREIGLFAAALSVADQDAPAAMRVARFRSLVGLVALDLARRKDEPVSEQDESSVRLHAQVVAAIRAHIETTMGKGVQLDALSHFSGYSKFHLLRMFRKEAGCTVHQYVDRIRMNAVRRLRAEGRTNGAIAEALGFSSPTSFIRWRRQSEAS